jgi:hypothetical protein
VTAWLHSLPSFPIAGNLAGILAQHFQFSRRPPYRAGEYLEGMAEAVQAAAPKISKVLPKTSKAARTDTPAAPHFFPFLHPHPARLPPSKGSLFSRRLAAGSRTASFPCIKTLEKG